LFPFPGGGHHILEPVLYVPSQLFSGQIVICIDRYYVTRAARSDHIIQLYAAHLLESPDGFEHRYAVTRPQVEYLGVLDHLLVDHILQGQRMRMGDIADMDEIPDTGAVACRIVIAIYRHLGQAADGRLGDHRNQVGGLSDRQFADEDTRMRAHRVEITEQDGFGLRRGLGEFIDDLLAHLLRIAVRRFGRLRRRLFGHRYLVGVAIHRTRRGKYEMRYLEFLNAFEQVDQRHDVVLEIHQGMLYRLTHRFIRGKMNDPRYILVLLDDRECVVIIA